MLKKSFEPTNETNMIKSAKLINQQICTTTYIILYPTNHLILSLSYQKKKSHYFARPKIILVFISSIYCCATTRVTRTWSKNEYFILYKKRKSKMNHMISIHII